MAKKSEFENLTEIKEVLDKTNQEPAEATEVTEPAEVSLTALVDYHGYAVNHETIKVKEGDVFTVCAATAARLMNDFPTWFKIN